MSIFSKSSRNNEHPDKMTNGRIVALTIVGLAILGAIGIAPRLWRDRQVRASAPSAELEAPLVTVGFPARAPNATDLVLPGSIKAVQETALFARVERSAQTTLG